ncbi:MAG: iron-containing alcohol dehydrogenase [Bacillota bacterium]|nr:iron-containing alcohol dehydrogenase [Bacillota bacterium]
MSLLERAGHLLEAWRGETYTFGWGAIGETGRHAASVGHKALVIANQSAWLGPGVTALLASLASAGVAVAGDGPVVGAAPNAPRADVYRLHAAMLDHQPDVVVAVGGGSTIDAAKAALVLAALPQQDGLLEAFFGMGEVSRALGAAGARLTPLVAVQTAASSAAHLTKYSNITDPAAAQKKLIVDDAIVPPRAVFDHELTCGAPAALTLDGAFDGAAHCLEVFWSLGAGPGVGTGEGPQAAILTGLELIVKYLPVAIRDLYDREAREALALGTDIGGYAIMVGGTSGPHLNSFSLVDVASHGRACAILNPYYAVFFAPAMEDRVRAAGEIYARYGYVDAGLDTLHGRELGLAVARGMLKLSRSLGYPTTLGELPGFARSHIDRTLAAAKNPQLAMKLRNMPVPVEADQVEKYLGPLLESAVAGDLDLIPSVQGSA